MYCAIATEYPSFVHKIKTINIDLKFTRTVVLKNSYSLQLYQIKYIIHQFF